MQRDTLNYDTVENTLGNEKAGQAGGGPLSSDTC